MRTGRTWLRGGEVLAVSDGVACARLVVILHRAGAIGGGASWGSPARSRGVAKAARDGWSSLRLRRQGPALSGRWLRRRLRVAPTLTEAARRCTAHRLVAVTWGTFVWTSVVPGVAAAIVSLSGRAVAWSRKGSTGPGVYLSIDARP